MVPVTDISQASGLVPSVPGIAKKGAGRAGGKRGVTFKAGLLADREYERYNGPLLSLDQVHNDHMYFVNQHFTVYITSKRCMCCSLIEQAVPKD